MASIAPADLDLKQGNPDQRVYHFDPEASPQQKAAIVGQVQDQLTPKDPRESAPAEREIPVSSTPLESPIPTIVVEDHGGNQSSTAQEPPKEPTPSPPKAKESDSEDAPAPPGSLANAAPYVIPDWYKVGWRQNSVLTDVLPEGEVKDKLLLDQFISEQYYGAWYHNAAVIVVAVFATHFATRFGFGWGWLFIILAFCSTYYSNSMVKFRRNARDDIQRDLVKVRLGSEHETAEWMNQFLQRFWLIYEPTLSKTIVGSVDQILSYYTPAFLDSLRLTTFTLGTKAPRIDSVRTFPNTDDDIVMMDWGFSFTPKDTMDLTQRQAEKQTNPKIVLSIKVGKGLALVTIPVLVENISVSGRMRVRMKLVNNFPHIQVVDVSFLEPPTIGYELRPVGGETFGMDIASIPGLSSFIRDMTHSILGPMMYEPNVFTLNLEQLLSGKPLDAAIGVLQVTVHSARGIKGVKIGGGTPDPYVSLSISERAELARTKWKNNTYNPTWMETKYILIANLHERLVLDLYDYNDHRANTKLGSTFFELEKLDQDAVHEGIISQLLKDGKERGELRYDVSYFPVIEPEQAKDAPESSVGIVRLMIHQAKDLDNSKSISGELNPLAKVYLNGTTKSAFTTRITKHTNNPVWEVPYEFLCSDREKEIITIKVIDDRDFLKDPVVGYISVRLNDLLDAKAQSIDWFNLSSCKSGKIRVSAEWKPVAMAGSLEGADKYKPPIGVVRLWANKAVDVKNVEAALGGKSDPYLRVQVRNVTKARTEVVNNNLNPVWDQILYIPVHSLRESLMLEVMDYENVGKDRSLGTTELLVSELAAPADDIRYPYQSTGRKVAEASIRLDKNKGSTSKGTLFYHAEFIPCMKLKDVHFDLHSDPLKRAHEEGEDEEGGSVDDGASMMSKDDHHGAVELTYKPLKKKKSKPTALNLNGNGNGTVANGNGTASGNGTATRSSTLEARDFALADGEVVGSEAEKGAISVPTTPVTPSTPGAHIPGTDGVDMSIDELLASQSGIIVFNVISGNLSKKGRIEVLTDDGYWPCFSTPKARSTNAQWDYVGEGFLKEIDFAQVWLRLDQAESDDKDDIAAEFREDAKQFLRSALRGPYQCLLKNKDGDPKGTVTVECRYIPVPVQLEPRETVNNQGFLHVELLEGFDLRAADRSGKSDPFVEFTLNGVKVYKSDAKKKTLTPEWKDESFDVEIPSRCAANFSLEVFDWNAIEQAKSLGVGQINIADMDPFTVAEQVVNLSTTKHGEKGHIRLRMVFKPQILIKTRKNTSTIAATGRAITQLPGGAAKGVLGLFKGKRADDGGFAALAAEAEAEEAQRSQPLGQASRPMDSPNDPFTAGYAPFPSSESVNNANGNNTASESGTLRVQVVDAKDLIASDFKPYVMLRLGAKEVKTKHTGKTSTPEWNESFTFAASPLTPKLHLWLFDHKTIGKDKEIGEGDVEIWRHIKPGSVSNAEVLVELRHGGQIRLRFEFDPTIDPKDTASLASGSDHAGHTRRLSSVHISPSRFSLRSNKRPTEEELLNASS